MIVSRYLKLAIAFVSMLGLGRNAQAMHYADLAHHFPESLSIVHPSFMTIEPYQHARDYDDLYQLFNDNYNNLGAWAYDHDSFPEDNQIRVARNYNKLAGFIIYRKDDNRGFINYVAVDHHMRNNGLGKILLKDAMNHLKQLGADSVSLNVYAHNTKAQSLYERLGFNFNPSSSSYSLMRYTVQLA